MVSDRKIPRQKKQQREGTSNVKKKRERAKGEDGRCKGSRPHSTQPERAMGLSLALSTLQKYLIGDEVLDELVEQRRSANSILRLYELNAITED